MSQSNDNEFMNEFHDDLMAPDNKKSINNQQEEEFKPLTIRNFLLTFKEFFIIWINQILCYNKIYSRSIFDKFKSFNLIVYKNRFPNFNKYLNDLIENIIINLIINKDKPNSLKSINCLILNEKTNEVKKKYSINFYQFIINLNKTIYNLNQDELDDTSALIEIQDLGWNEIYTQFNTILFQHIQELKKSNDGREVNDSNFNSSTNFTSDDNNDSQDNDLFFKITVDVDKSIYITKNNWTRLNEDVGGGNNATNSTKFMSIGNLDLKVLNLDFSNEYY
ncbi:unnamed protein product [Candida verbasci]|uniref:HORMA domain-containing protein n=1 Tax=Candida verbasci TaxID=1227364 RepID=A0A9W4XA84_9ASCO|nr:unnamed protein product [Candida verbasci]